MRIESGTVIEAARFAFDMDGTLIDSTGLIENAWVHWANQHDLDVTEILQACHGRRAIETVARFAVPGMDVEAEATQVADFVDRRLDELKPAPGAMELLRSLPTADWGLVTSAQRPIAERWMRHLEFPIPRVFIAAEDVVAGKPHPMPYIAAARALGCRTEEMVVLRIRWQVLPRRKWLEPMSSRLASLQKVTAAGCRTSSTFVLPRVACTLGEAAARLGTRHASQLRSRSQTLNWYL